MTTIIFLAVFFPVLISLGIIAVMRARARRDKRLADYRNSPESRILRLDP